MQHTEKSEAHSLLRNSLEEFSNDYVLASPQRKHKLLRASICANLVIFMLNLAAGIILLQLHAVSSSKSYSIHSPLNQLIQTQEEYWNLTLGDRTPFTVGLNKEVDALWDGITAPPGKVGTIKVSKDDLEKGGLESVELADGSGYLATVDVFHQLHCLDLLRKQLFNSTYKISPIDHPLWEDHIAHCIDSIRLSLQCNADASLITWKWLKGYGNPWPDFRTKHQCRNWDNILDWARKETFDLTMPGMLVHPDLGPVDRLEGKWFRNPLRDGRRVEYIMPT